MARRLFDSSKDRFIAGMVFTKEGFEVDQLIIWKGGRVSYTTTNSGDEIVTVYSDGRFFATRFSTFDYDLMIEIPKPEATKMYSCLYHNISGYFYPSITEAVERSNICRTGMQEITFANCTPTSVRLMDKSEYENI